MFTSSPSGLLRQPVATVLAGALLVVGVSGTAWAAFSVDPDHSPVHRPAAPAQPGR